MSLSKSASRRARGSALRFLRSLAFETLDVREVMANDFAQYDINPGTADSRPGEHTDFVQVGAKLFFSATDATNGRELRFIDTAAPNPTVQLIDVNPGAPDGITFSFNRPAVAVGNRLYFFATDTAHGTEPRWLDATEENPVVHNIDANPGTDGAFNSTNVESGFGVVGTKVFFSAKSGTEPRRLRWIDTTDATEPFTLFPPCRGTWHRVFTAGLPLPERGFFSTDSILRRGTNFVGSMPPKRIPRSI
jgi:ELWxxDGT repeat protein